MFGPKHPCRPYGMGGDAPQSNAEKGKRPERRGEAPRAFLKPALASGLSLDCLLLDFVLLGRDGGARLHVALVFDLLVARLGGGRTVHRR